MGKVVELPGGSRRRRRRRSTTALVLGGGGFTAGVYEIGALRALDLLAVNMTVNDFDVYVGTSSGSFVAALAANGITPEEMMRVVDQPRRASMGDIGLGQLLEPNLAEIARKSAAMPMRTAQVLRRLVPRLGNVSLVDIMLELAEGLPSGAYSSAGVERYVRRALDQPDRTDDFRRLAAELYIPTTDLDTCERIVMGKPGWDDVPISTAVRASAALPMVYAPVRVRDRDLIDGGVTSTTNLDLAVEAGARFIVVINPLVPYVNDVKTSGGRHISQMGFPQIGFQAFKLLAYQRLHEVAKQWEERYPGVDIVLVEPEPDDALMFQTSMMSYTSRVAIARHGFESVTRRLAGGFERYRPIAERHGIELSPTRVRRVVRHFDAERPTTSAWRKILEQTTGSLLRQSAGE